MNFTCKKKPISQLISLVLACSSSMLGATGFDPVQGYETGGPAPNVVSMADFNGDGHTDMLVSSETKVNFLLGDGSGVLEKKSNIRLDGVAAGGTTGDFDGDGDLDVALSHIVISRRTGYRLVYETAIFFNDGAARPGFTAASYLPYYGNKRIESADFNNDGLDDLEIDGTILLSQGDGSFVETDSYRLPSGVPYNHTATFFNDVNGDGNIDILYAGLYTSKCGNGDGTFYDCTDVVLKADEVLADVNDDGIADIISPVVTSFKKVAYKAWVGGSSCGTVVSYSYSRRGGYRGGRGRIRSTRCFSTPSALVTRYRDEPATSVIDVTLRYGDGITETLRSVEFDGEVTQLDVVDMDGNGAADIAIRIKDSKGFTLLGGAGDGSFDTVEQVINVPSIITYEDLNEDGLMDLVYVDLSVPTKADSDAWAFVHLQTANTPADTNAGATTVATPTATATAANEPTTTATTSAATTSSASGSAPAIDPNGETLELAGTITEVSSNYFVVDGTTIWYDASTSFKFEAGFDFVSGNTAQVEALPNVDGSGTAIKVQIGPL